MSPPTSGPTRVIIKLPYNRPSEGFANPPVVDWNGEKESILWEVIAKSRSSESSGTDWQGLAAHLDVPLPYLLFRAQTRYEEDLKGLQGLRGAFGKSPTLKQRNGATQEESSPHSELQRRVSNRASGSGRLPGSSSGRLTTPLTIRTRLNSLGHDSTKQSKAASSSTITLQGRQNTLPPKMASSSPLSGSDSESEEEANRIEAEERKLEEQDALDRKLKHLQTVMTSEAVGLVRDPRSRKGKEPAREREAVRSPTSPLRHQAFHRGDLSSSELNSSNTSSPQGSLPDIPSPPPETSQYESPSARHFRPGTKSSSPPAVVHAHAHMRYRPMAVEKHASDRSSTQGSTASSFSDISDSLNLSSSALESALMSNIRGTGSRFSAFARSQFTRRASRGPTNAGMD